MMDFDPRDLDDERPVSHLSHGEPSRGGGDTRPTLGRGPSSADRETERPSRDQVIDLRDRDHDGRTRHRDGPSRDVFERHVDLPRGRGLRGLVTRREYGRGSKSERQALMLDTEEGTFLLRQRGGPSFGETGLEPMLDLVVECDGTIVEGRLLLVDRIGASTQGPPGLDTPAPGAPPKSARAAKRRRIQGD